MARTGCVLNLTHPDRQPVSVQSQLNPLTKKSVLLNQPGMSSFFTIFFNESELRQC